MAVTKTKTETLPLLVGGEWRITQETIAVRDPYDDSLVAEVSAADTRVIDDALERAAAAFEVTRRLPAHERSRILTGISDGIRARRDELVDTIVHEAGKPIRDARAEVDRHALAFGIAAEEARRIPTEWLDMDWAPMGERRFGVNRRFPIGPVLSITPFNFPLNLVGHKLAPCIAVGNPLVIKPASKTPLSAFHLAELALASGWPPEAISVVPCRGELIERFVTDPRVSKISFTGSAEVGWRLKELAWRKRITLEMGGNGAVVVHDDADLDRAIERIGVGGFTYAGQSCISVQRVFVHEAVWAPFLERLTERVRALRLGDPSEEATDIGPMVTTGAAERASSWVDEAVAEGARIVVGGGRRGAFMEPTLLVDCQPWMRICREEVFAPVVALFRYRDLANALEAVNASRYGLQAGVFTRDIGRIAEAFDRIEVGGLMINEVPTWRMDHMPYGGVKDSGWGREGIRYSILEMTEPRLLMVTL